MILHLLIYSQGTERQFASYVLRQFSAPEMRSSFVIMSSEKGIRDFTALPNVRYVNPESQEDMSLLLDSLSDFSAIILHGAFEPWCEIVLTTVPDSVKVAWVFWGGEIYGRHELAYSYLGPWTKRIYQTRNAVKGVSGRSVDFYEIPKHLYQRVNYCLTDMEEEYRFAQHYLNAPDMKFLWYNYYSIEETVGELKDSCCNGTGIFLGNSATIECNYFDCFFVNRIAKQNDSNVVVPLGYGSPWVRNLVLKLGRTTLRERFLPLVTFLPREEYNKVLLSCSAMIQPHFRPQAQGNIITGLWLGMRVFLSEKNLAYQYFKRIGVEVYSLENELKQSFNPSITLDPVIVHNNRRILSYWYGYEGMRNRLLELVSVLDG